MIFKSPNSGAKGNLGTDRKTKFMVAFDKAFSPFPKVKFYLIRNVETCVNLHLDATVLGKPLLTDRHTLKLFEITTDQDILQ